MALPQAADPHVDAQARLRDRLEAETLVALEPPPRLTVSEWADRFRQVPSYSSEPGQWVTAKTPYLREIMDSFSDPLVNKVVFKKCARIGATEAGLNVIGYYIAHDPSSIFIVQPTVDDAKDFSKEQLTPTIEDTEVLRARVRGQAAKESGNTIQAKLFEGGAIYLVGANSARGFRRRTARVVILEEVDGYPPSAGTEGDQVKLAERRAATFQHRRKVYLNSTPTVAGSRIDREFKQSDQRYYFVPCPDCGHTQTLTWDRLHYKGLPTPAYCCAECGVLIPEERKFGMVQAGEWRPTNAGHPTRGYHLNALYSPWVPWADLVQEWHEAQGDPLKLQVFLNTALGQEWEDREGQTRAEALALRAEAYPDGADVPDGVALLTAGVDVQPDRLEVVVRGWCTGERSYLAAYEVLHGDVHAPAVWAQLDDLLARDWRCADGGTLRIVTTCIDASYEQTLVMDWARPRFGRGVYATKGRSAGGPLLPRKPTPLRHGGRLYMLGVEAGKDLLYGRLHLPPGTPGAYHWPQGLPAEYWQQLVAERRVPHREGGATAYRWEAPTGARTEVPDCERLALVAVRLCPVRAARFEALVAKRIAEAATVPRPTDTPAPAPDPLAPLARPSSRPRRGGFVHGWR